jgi:hypothetical protein
MEAIIERFLKAKHWQLFLLIFGLPMVFQITAMWSVLSNISDQTNPDPSFVFNYFRFFPVLMILFIGVFFGWFWSVVMGLQKKVPTNIKMKIKKFQIFFFIPITYMLFLSVAIGVAMSAIPELIKGGEEPSIGLIGSIMAVILPLHFLSMFCIFYVLYFVAKTFKTVELQREVTFSDFAGEFFMIWFYPIGIWVVQPKINKMAEDSYPIGLQ